MEQKLSYYVINEKDHKISKKSISVETLNKLNNSRNKAHFIIGYDNYLGVLPVLHLTNKNTIGKLTATQEKILDFCNFSKLLKNSELSDIRDLYHTKTKNMFRLYEVVNALKNHFNFDQSDIDNLNGKFRGSIRYWGDWVNPENAENEEDYDWKVLSKKSYKKLTDIVNCLNKKFKKAKITFMTSEKCWLDFEVEEAKK